MTTLSRGQCTAFSAVVVGGGCVRRGVGRGHPLCGRLLEAVIFVGPSIVLPPATTLNAACSCACGDRYASLCPRRKTAFTAPCFFVLQEIQSKKARGFGTHFFSFPCHLLRGHTTGAAKSFVNLRHRPCFASFRFQRKYKEMLSFPAVQSL